MQSSAQLLKAYLDTHYDVRLPGGQRASLRIGASVPGPVRDWIGRDWPLLCISACNPHSQRLSAMANRMRMRQLLDTLADEGCSFRPGVGHVPGHAWRESTIFASAASVSLADRLARRFGQNAIVMASEGECVRLRIHAYPLWQALAGNRFADWAG